LDLEEFYLAGHAGSGQEDHGRTAVGGSMAQPSGLTHDENHLLSPIAKRVRFAR
jgi:hypothetical protein